MKAAVLHEPKRIQLENRPKPKVGPKRCWCRFMLAAGGARVFTFSMVRSRRNGAARWSKIALFQSAALAATNVGQPAWLSIGGQPGPQNLRSRDSFSNEPGRKSGCSKLSDYHKGGERSV